MIGFTRTSFGDVILLNDSRYISLYNWAFLGQPVVTDLSQAPSTAFSNFEKQLGPATFTGNTLKTSQASTFSLGGMTTLRSVNEVSGNAPGDFVTNFTVKSVFDVTFEVTSSYKFDSAATFALSEMQLIGVGHAQLRYRLAGVNGDLFNYDLTPSSLVIGDHTSGVLAPGQYRLYGETYVQGAPYKAESYRGSSRLDFTMDLTPEAVPESEMPLLLLIGTLLALMIRHQKDKVWQTSVMKQSDQTTLRA